MELHEKPTHMMRGRPSSSPVSTAQADANGHPELPAALFIGEGKGAEYRPEGALRRPAPVVMVEHRGAQGEASSISSPRRASERPLTPDFHTGKDS